MLALVWGCASEPAPAADATPGGGLATLPDGAANTPVCDDDLAWFRRELWTPLLGLRCVGCHNVAGPARASRFLLRGEDEPDWLAHNLRATAAMARTQLAGVPLLLLRPTGAHPMGHTGGTLAAPGSPEHELLTRFVARAQTDACDDPEAPAAGADGGAPVRCTAPAPGARVLRRLTPEEYDRTVRDLTGVDAHHGARFVADPVVEGFHNDAAQLTVSPLLAEQLRVAAESVATEAARALPRVSPCAPATPTDVACARRFVAAFGARAFRRPLVDDEVTRYLTLHTTITAAEGFAEGVEAVISAMLQSPHFLYRSELGVAAGGVWRLTPWEVATELSYLFTGTMPDDALFAAAGDGTLATPAGVEVQARRLLASPAAREGMRRFVRQWLEVDRVGTVPKDAAQFADFTPAVRAAMSQEFDRYVDAVLAAPRVGLTELLSGAFTFVDPTLAAFYGVTASGAADAQGFRRVDMPEAQRAGLLTLGAVMAVHARPNSSSPIHRGRMVRERLLCQSLPPPPPGINAQPPTPDPTRSLREQYAMHASVRPCVDCHRLIDPIGYTFESFDGVGRARTQENGMTLDTRGEIVGSARSDTPLRDARDLVAHLAASPEVQDCFARQVFRYAYAVPVTAQTACTLAEVQRGFRDEGRSIPELLVALTRSVHFVTRVGEAVPTPSPTDAAVVTDAALAVDAPATDAAAARDAGVATTPGVTTATTRDSAWETGFCERVAVTNTTASALTWTVVHRIDGRVTTSWNSERVGDGGDVVFRGAMWNRTLAPGERTELGFCASR
jgi:hypothetical protein